MIKKLKQAGEVLKKLKPFIAPYKWGFLGTIVTAVISVAAMTSAPRIEGMITTQLAKDASEITRKIPGAGVHFDVILKILLILAVIYIIKMGTQIISMFLLTNSIQSAMHDMRNAVQDKIRRLPVKYFDTHSFGDTLSRVTNDIDSVSNGLQQSFIQVISGILTLVLVLVMVFTIQPVMAWLVVLIIPVSILISIAVVKRSQKQFKAQQDSLGELNGAITELYTGYNEIILFGRQKPSLEQFREINGRLQKHALKAQFISSIMSPLISLSVYLCIGGVAVSGTVFVIQGMLTVGNLQAFIRYIWQCNEPLSQVAQLSSQIQAAFAGLKRIFEILDEPEEIPDPEPCVPLKETKGEVVFEHVSFGYGDTPVIRDLDIKIKNGQMVAIVGPTGAGKTTIINLLLRFYDTDSGRILIDGVDIRTMKREDLRSQFGMVLQDTWLFSGTIYENIKYGRLDARKDEVIDAAKTANVHHFIRTLPKGYDMEIDEEGSNISQGEKQLLTIARAVLKDPKILILDEATSSVDTRLEKMLQEAMHKLLAGRTSFVIAHRLSTIKNADLILVLKEGQIVETGTHQELLDKKGYYEQLYHSQFSV
ncbi:ABC transporter ATP-binding protein [Anaerostipes sp.]|uniref:ABC transporter ATP-binding protein n=1 Tax=Anaerostipes sp. TaxID=1872530 RepID=UPI0025BE2A31|nr:ABC transporter ATP-binding protein [Anaerostipes sp.]MBS7009666.1 ABC transporter ATP-binding protein [Anaerostipes sp.]